MIILFYFLKKYYYYYFKLYNFIYFLFLIKKLKYFFIKLFKKILKTKNIKITKLERNIRTPILHFNPVHCCMSKSHLVPL